MNGEPERFYREVVFPYGGNDCLLWPYGCSGGNKNYGMINGEYVHRRLCEEEHGPPPTPDHEAAHSCGKGHIACVTKRHLRWATPVENSADSLLHGTRARGERNGQAKLTEPEAREILALKGKLSQRVIAERYSVARTAVSAIHCRRSWPGIG